MAEEECQPEKGSALHCGFTKPLRASLLLVVLSLQLVAQQRTCALVRMGDLSTYYLHTKVWVVFPVRECMCSLTLCSVLYGSDVCGWAEWEHWETEDALACFS